LSASRQTRRGFACFAGTAEVLVGGRCGETTAPVAAMLVHGKL
jgi:hypothetical protein